MRFARYKYALLLVDIFVVYMCFMCSAGLRFGGINSSELIAAILLPLIGGFIFQYFGLYKINIFLNRSLSAVQLIKSLISLSIVYLIGGFLSKFAWIAPSRLAFLYFVGLLFVLFVLYRVLLLPIVFRALSAAGLNRRRVLIVGANESGRQIASSLTVKKELGARVIGFVDDMLDVGSAVVSGFHVLGNTESLPLIVETNLCDEVVIAGDHIREERLLALIGAAKKTRTTVKVVADIFSAVSQASITESYDHQPTATLTRGFYSPITRIYQRIADILLSAAALVLISPFFLAAAIAIRLSSQGPVFFTHVRVGKDGKPFRMYKFRSMYVTGEEDAKRKQMMLNFMREGRSPLGKSGDRKVIDDSRVTPVGRLLRRTSFDEMPQLLNVLKGDMSLVGPRPVLPYEHEAMKEWHRERDRVLPGCTGFWQVYGRAKTSFDDMVIMDIYMNENMSPWLYLQLLLKTIPVLILGSGGK